MSSKEMIVRKASSDPTSASGAEANGAAVYIGDMDPSTVAFTVVGTYTSTMQIQVSLDGVNWFQCGADIAGTGAVSSRTEMATAGSSPRASAAWARLHCSAFTSIASVGLVCAGMPASL